MFLKKLKLSKFCFYFLLLSLIAVNGKAATINVLVLDDINYTIKYADIFMQVMNQNFTENLFHGSYIDFDCNNIQKKEGMLHLKAEFTYDSILKKAKNYFEEMSIDFDENSNLPIMISLQITWKRRFFGCIPIFGCDECFTVNTNYKLPLKESLNENSNITITERGNGKCDITVN